MTYKQVFPRFGDLDVTLPHGFEDQSNDQDDCPSFALFAEGNDGDAILTIFIDYKEEGDRVYAMEQGASPCRFHAHVNATGKSLTTNEWDEVLEWAETNRPKPIYFDGFDDEEHVINPTCCDPRGTACNPAIYGFAPVATGGGCLALRRDLPDGSYILLTDTNGCGIDLGEFGEEFFLGLYGCNGEELGMWAMQVGYSYNSPQDVEEGDGTPRNQLLPPLAYNDAGHICPMTGRIAMTVADAYARDDSPDRHFTIYGTEAAALGMDPWRMIDGLDATTETGADGRPVGYTLDFASGSSVDVKPDRIIYMQRTKAEKESRYSIDLEGDDGVTVTLKGITAGKSMSAEEHALALMKHAKDWRIVGIDREPS